MYGVCLEDAKNCLWKRMAKHLCATMNNGGFYTQGVRRTNPISGRSHFSLSSLWSVIKVSCGPREGVLQNAGLCISCDYFSS